MKIGITEAGDAALDYTWVEKAPEMDMMILITKSVTDKFISEALKFANKTIIHATCTGYGGSKMEPGVPLWKKQIDQTRKLIAMGFPAEQIVVRIDPIFPTPKGIAMIERIVEAAQPDLKRFRISVLDNYPHVQNRFKAIGFPVMYNGNFQASDEEFAAIDAMLSKLKFRFGVTFESCAEPNLKKAEPVGCVNAKDMSMLGLKPTGGRKKKQRGECLCAAGKTEMLPFNHFWYCRKDQCAVKKGTTCSLGNCEQCSYLEIYGCPNRCAYCYWKT